MKSILFSMLFIAATQPVYSQLQGKVVNEQGAPIPFVNVLLLNASDSTMISGALSADDGHFEIDNIPIDESKTGSYILRLSLLGFENWYSDSFNYSLAQPVKDFGTLLLSEETILMDGVMVRAQRMQIEQSIEGTTVNVQSSLMSRGSSALQVLERSPGVMLDQRNNELMLNGKSGTLLMINGRPVRMAPSEVISLLEGMSADNLAKVELLTNPSAKYDAEGSAGIINLVTNQKDDEGTNGSASISAGYGWGAKEAHSINLNHRNGSINYYGAYSYNYDHYFTDFHGLGSQSIPSLGGEVNLDFKNNSTRKRGSHNATAGMEKEFGSGILLGGNIIYTNSTIRTSIYNDGNYIFEDDSFLHADINVSGKAVQNNLNTSLYTEKQLKNDGKISFDANHIYYNNFAPTQVESTYKDVNGDLTDPENEIYSPGNRGESMTNINIGVVKLDYETRIGSNMKLESGIKGSISKTGNEAIIESLRDNTWVADERNRSNMEINEKIGASYLSFHVSFDSLTTLTTGFRYEYWDRDFSEEGLDRRFGKLFPSTFLSRTLSASSSLQLAYNRRITQPDYHDLTNFLRYNDPTSVFTGTPGLQPAISDNLKLGYQFIDKNISLVYTYETNPIARFQIVENDRSDLVIIAPQNIDYIRSLGAQAHIPVGITRWWNLTTGGTVSSRRFKLSYTRQPVTKSYIAYNFYLNQSFLLPKDFSVELSGFYNSDHYNGSVAVQGYGALNFGFKKDFKNNYGSLQFSITDILESMTIRSEYGALTEEAFNSRTTVKFQPESAHARIFRLSYSINFGNIKTKGFRQRQSGSQEERSRIGQ